MAGTKTLRVGVLTPVNTLNPREAQDFVSQTAVTQIYESPFAQPAAGRLPEPILFQERLRQDSPTEYSATLRSDIRFSDGTPLNARHVADSLARVAALREQVEVEARGERVIFRLSRPNARFDLVLAQRYSAVTLETRGTLLGTGPYMVAPGSTPDRTRLVRNPHARRQAPIDEIVMQLYPPDPQGKPEALLGALEAGEVDFTNVLSREDIMRLKNVRRLTEPGSSTAILYLNTQRPGLDDPRVRRAIALSIDRLEIAKLFYATATAFAATNLLPPMLGRGNDGLSPDGSKARGLLASPDVRKPGRLSLLLIFGPRPYLPNPRKVGEYIAAQIDKLGIAVDVVPTSNLQEYRARVQSGDYDMALAGWIADTLDPMDFLEAMLSSDSIPTSERKAVLGANVSRWSSREMDETLASLRQEPREDVRAALLKRIADEVPLLPLMYGPTIYAHSWKVKNFTPAPLGIPLFWELDLQ
jgi:peptide/nickel transport system substrate-binding protein